MGNLLLIYLSTLSLGTAKFILDLSGVYLLLQHSLLTTCPQFFSPAKNFNPDDLHSLYTIDQNNLVTLLYLIATVFLQLWNFALSNIRIQTMLSIPISPVDKCLINFVKSFNLLHFSNLLMQGLIRPVAGIGSGDPVRVLCLYTTITLDEVCSIYC